jgi:hypothetical protein
VIEQQVSNYSESVYTMKCQLSCQMVRRFHVYVACVKHSGNGDKMLPELSKQHKGEGLVNGREVKFAPNTEVA